MTRNRYAATPAENQDWPSWARANAPRLLAPGGIENATLLDCRRLFGSFQRQDRFCEGALAAAESDGTLARLRARIDALLAEGCEP